MAQRIPTWYVMNASSYTLKAVSYSRLLMFSRKALSVYTYGTSMFVTSDSMIIMFGVLGVQNSKTKVAIMIIGFAFCVQCSKGFDVPALQQGIWRRPLCVVLFQPLKNQR